jgi:hypothetical protein
MLTFLVFFVKVNYFIVHPISVSSALVLHAKVALSAILIGLPTVSAIVMAIIHNRFLIEEQRGKRDVASSFSMYLVFMMMSSLSAIVGNAVQAYGIWNLSCLYVVSYRVNFPFFSR